MVSTQTAPPASARSNATSTVVHLAFVFSGVVTTLLAPILPALAARWALQDAQLGRLFTAQFLGSMMGTALSGVVVHRHGFRASLTAGYALMAVGVAALASAGWPAALACVVTYGFGIGLSIPASNVYVAETQPHRSAAALNILNFAWTAGAISAPWIFALVHSSNGLALYLGAIAAGVALMALCTAIVRWPPRPARHLAPAILQVEHAMPLLAGLGLLFMLYMGTESALGFWIATYSQRIGGANGIAWVVVPSFLWAALLLGRLSAPAVLRRVSEPALVRGGLAIATAGMIVITTSSRLYGVVLGVTVAGLGLAAVFPLLVACMARRFGASSPRAASILFLLGNVGGMVLPLAVGVASTASGKLQAGLWVPVFGSAAMLALYGLVLPREQRA